MRLLIKVNRIIPAMVLAMAILPNAFAQTAKYGPHLWAPPVDPAIFEKRVNEQLEIVQKAVAQILAVKGTRTIENTLQPYDQAVEALDTAGYGAGLVQSVDPQAAMRDRAQAMVQKVSAAATEFGLNQALYKAIAGVDISKSDSPSRYYVTRTLLEFRLAGVDRDDATRARIKALNDEITKYATDFQRNTQDSVLKVVVKNRAELDGLPDDFIARHPAAADGSITLTSEPPDVYPVLKFARNADLRKRVYLAYTNRAYPQNVQVLADLLQKRQELAALLGYKHWADMNAADKMAVDGKSIGDFIDRIDLVSRPTATREYQMLLTQAKKQDPSLNNISLADRSYYSEQVRRADYDFDSQSARPYFPYDRVQQGILDVASRLFQVTFRPAKDAQVWDPSVTAWDVFEGDRQLGRFYLDMHPRAGKDKWFSSYSILDGKLGQQLPEAALICNFSGGTAGDPGLMEYGDVTTFFHEFGHLMHWIFQGQRPWAGFGNNLESDFVEAPSQMLEEWMHDPKVLDTFALNYQTNQPIPPEMVHRMNRADAFGRGLWTRSQLVYTSVSFDLHNEAPSTASIDSVFPDNTKRFLPYQLVDGDHQVASFTHLTGYSSSYYTYLWDKVIAEDFFGQFNPNDLLASDIAKRYRKTVLEKTGSMPANDLVKNFLGRPQSVDAFVGWMNQEFDEKPATPVAAAH